MIETIASDLPFSANERACLAWLADQMIPTEGSLPGGGDETIQAEVVVLLARHTSLVSAVMDELQTLAEATTDASNLAEFRARHPAFIQVFQQAVIASYYRQDLVLKSLGLPARAPFPGGNPVAPTDWALLDPVRDRQPFFREVD